LILAHGNPHGTKRLADLHAKQLRLVDRQQTAGSYLLLIHLLEPADLSRQDLNLIDNTARSETDVAVTLLDGKADAGGVSASRPRRASFGLIFCRCIASATISPSCATIISSRHSSNCSCSRARHPLLTCARAKRVRCVRPRAGDE
jgi:hypothetical protein